MLASPEVLAGLGQELTYLLLQCGDRAVAGDVIVNGDLAHPGVEQLPDVGHQPREERIVSPCCFTRGFLLHLRQLAGQGAAEVGGRPGPEGEVEWAGGWGGGRPKGQQGTHVRRIGAARLVRGRAAQQPPMLSIAFSPTSMSAMLGLAGSCSGAEAAIAAHMDSKLPPGWDPRHRPRRPLVPDPGPPPAPAPSFPSS